MKYVPVLFCIVIYFLPLAIHAADLKLSDSLCTAVSNNNLNQAKKALKAGADINGSDYPPLHRAANSFSPRMVSFIVTEGADVNRQDFLGDTALHIVEDQFANYHTIRRRRSNHHMKNNLLEIASALIKAGADLTIKNKKGKTALDNAKESYSRLKALHYDASLIDIFSTALKKQDQRREQKVA